MIKDAAKAVRKEVIVCPESASAAVVVVAVAAADVVVDMLMA